MNPEKRREPGHKMEKVTSIPEKNQDTQTRATEAQELRRSESNQNIANEQDSGRNSEALLKTNAGQSLNQENQPTPDQYVQLDMFKENNIPVAEKNKSEENQGNVLENQRLSEIDYTINKIETKTKDLENALNSLQNGDKSQITEVELNNLQTKLPGFILRIEEKIDSLSTEIGGLEAGSLKEKLQKNLEAMQELLAAAEATERQLRPREEQTEKAKATITRIEGNIETLNNYKEIMGKLSDSLSELKELLENHGSVNESEKTQIEKKIKALIEKINQLIEQIQNQEEEINKDKIQRANEIQTQILELQNDPEAEEGKNDSEINTLKSEYVTLQNETENNLTEFRDLFSTVQEKLSSEFNSASLNDQLRQDIGASLSKSESAVSEKFQKIEKGGRLSNLQV